MTSYIYRHIARQRQKYKVKDSDAQEQLYEISTLLDILIKDY
jgi:hypothetical protein